MVKAKSQVDKFREAAREHEADEDEDKFNDALRRVAKSPPPKDDKKPEGNANGGR